MTITLNEQGQITIPEDLRTKLGWEPGIKLVLAANEHGELFLRPERVRKPFDEERFLKAIGSAPPWPGGTDAYMEFLRGPYEDLPPIEE
jgi:AbrB family looped-hinge helix DNA binding protein